LSAISPPALAVILLLIETHSALPGGHVHSLCGIISSPHLLHFTRFGALIFQFALLLSRLALDTFPLGTAILYAGKDEGFAAAARQVAQETRDAINQYR
jgi:hypothetical protein